MKIEVLGAQHTFLASGLQSQLTLKAPIDRHQHVCSIKDKVASYLLTSNMAQKGTDTLQANEGSLAIV